MLLHLGHELDQLGLVLIIRIGVEQLLPSGERCGRFGRSVQMGGPRARRALKPLEFPAVFFPYNLALRTLA
jgi:hypothetical protein